MSECPTANEFGVRNNPVCIDEVDTSQFTNLDDGVTAAPAIAVSSLSLSLSFSLSHSLTFSLSLSLPLPCVAHFVFLL